MLLGAVNAAPDSFITDPTQAKDSIQLRNMKISVNTSAAAFIDSFFFYMTKHISSWALIGRGAATTVGRDERGACSVRRKYQKSSSIRNSDVE